MLNRLKAIVVTVASASQVVRGVGTHISTTRSHRRWIRDTYELLRLSGAVDDSLQARVTYHDLSKFHPVEMLGYSIMFGPTGRFRQLDTDWEKYLWNKALQHHYCANGHHPENTAGRPMGKLDLQESVIDMLACRLERNLNPSGDVIPVSSMFSMEDRYLTRYVPDDAILVKRLVAEWQQQVDTMLRSAAADFFDKWARSRQWKMRLVPSQ